MRLLTYNLLEGALPDRLPKALRVIKSAHADVVAIQEARYWRRNHREIFQRVARDLRMRGVLFRANSGFDLAVFSRFPILRHENYGLDTVFLHTAGAVDLKTPRGAVLTLFAAHLRPEYRFRMREVRLLLQWMRPYRTKWCALCGDLNSLTEGDYLAQQYVRPGSELRLGPQGTIAAIRRAKWVDCFRTRNPRLPGLTLGTGRRVARVDYVFASPPLAERLTGCRVLSHPEARAASDHSPVWAEFEV